MAFDHDTHTTSSMQPFEVLWPDDPVTRLQIRLAVAEAEGQRLKQEAAERLRSTDYLLRLYAKTSPSPTADNFEAQKLRNEVDELRLELQKERDKAVIDDLTRKREQLRLENESLRHQLSYSNTTFLSNSFIPSVASSPPGLPAYNSKICQDASAQTPKNGVDPTVPTNSDTGPDLIDLDHVVDISPCNAVFAPGPNVGPSGKKQLTISTASNSSSSTASTDNSDEDQPDSPATTVSESDVQPNRIHPAATEMNSSMSTLVASQVSVEEKQRSLLPFFYFPSKAERRSDKVSRNVMPIPVFDVDAAYEAAMERKAKEKTTNREMAQQENVELEMADTRPISASYTSMIEGTLEWAEDPSSSVAADSSNARQSPIYAGLAESIHLPANYNPLAAYTSRPRHARDENWIIWQPKSPLMQTSHRLTISNLPANTTSHMLLSRIQGGIVISASLLDTRALTSSLTALIRFESNSASAAFAAHYASHPLTFPDISGSPVRARVELVPTPSFPLTAKRIEVVRRLGHTRCIEMKGFPVSMESEDSKEDFRWWLRPWAGCALDEVEEVKVKDEGHVSVSFLSVDAAEAAVEKIMGNRLYRSCVVRFVEDPCARPLLEKKAEEDFGHEAHENQIGCDVTDKEMVNNEVARMNPDEIDLIELD